VDHASLLQLLMTWRCAVVADARAAPDMHIVRTPKPRVIVRQRESPVRDGARAGLGVFS
jgi:hypothetical protein